MPYYPPPGGSGGGTLSLLDRGLWVAFATYAPGNIFTSPVDGSRWSVLQQYTAGPTYAPGGVDGPPNTTFLTAAGVTTTAGDLRWSGIGSSFREVATFVGDTFYVGYDADTNGTDMVAAGSAHAFEGLMDLPAVGADLHCDISLTPASTGIEAVVATLTIAAGTVRGALNPLGTDIAFADGDKFTASISQVGSTYAGSGLKLRMALNGRTFINPFAAPATPTGLAQIAATATSITVGWTNSANSRQVILYRDGLPYATLRGVTQYTDLGPLGTGLALGETHTYAIQARRFNVLSAISGNVNGTAQQTYRWIPNAGGAGTVDATMLTVIKGSNVSGPGVTDVAGPPERFTVTSTNVGANSPNDRVLLKHIKDSAGASTTHTAAILNVLMDPSNSSGLWEILMRTSIMTTTNDSPADRLRFGMSTFGLGVNLIAGSFDPTVGGAGTGAIGSVQNLTSSAYPTNQVTGATRTASGNIAWPTTVVPGTLFGLRFELLVKDPTLGTQTLNIRQGSLAQYNADPTSMPLFMTVLLSQPQVAGMSTAGGLAYFNQVSTQSAGGTVLASDIADWSYTPLTGAAA